MKIKQIKLVLLVICLVISSAVGLVSFGSGGGTANAYTCGAPGNIDWEYHVTGGSGFPAGSCWRVNWKPSGNEINSGPTTTCPSGEIMTSGTCYVRNGYTLQETGTIYPTQNDGSPIPASNATCANGYEYSSAGHFGEGAGCYMKDPNNSSSWCHRGVGTAQGGSTQNGQGGTQTCASTTPNSDPNADVIPKNPAQSTDKTSASNNNANGVPSCQGHGTLNTGTGKCSDNTTPATTGGASGSAGGKPDYTCGQAQTNLISCNASDCGVGNGTFSGTPVIGCVLKFAISALTVLVGIGAVGGIAWEALQYARAEDDQSIVSGAKNRIRDIVLGLIVYAFMIAIIGWLVPGSVISG